MAFGRWPCIFPFASWFLARQKGDATVDDRFPQLLSERTARLFNVLGRAGTKAVYTYDFGDSWEHQIVVEKRLAAEPGRAYPACLAGERNGPPEDCGGIPGFYNPARGDQRPRSMSNMKPSAFLRK